MKRACLLGGIAAVAVLATAATPARAYPRPGTTFRVSVRADGSDLPGRSATPVLSSDGRFAAFASDAPLDPADGNGVGDVYVRDNATGAVERVSVGAGGVDADRPSGRPSISEDGQRVVFTSTASNLVPGDTNGHVDVFLYDRGAGSTLRVSVGAAGNQGVAGSQDGVIAGNGRFVAFWSEDDTLHPDDRSPYGDIFVRDLATGALDLVSVSAFGPQSVFDPSGPSISDDGRFVAFSARSPTLVAGDVNGVFEDVFVRDRQARTTTRLTAASTGGPANNHSYTARISGDGRTVAFASLASNLVPGDTAGWGDVFAVDVASGAIERVSVWSSGVQGDFSAGSPAISDDGRYVAWSGPSVVPDADHNTGSDVFVHDRLTRATELVSAALAGGTGNQYSHSPSLSGNGRFVGFTSDATDLVPDDGNTSADSFVRDRGPALGFAELTAAARAGAGVTVEGAVRVAGGPASFAADATGDAATAPPGNDIASVALVERPEEGDVLAAVTLASMPSVAAGSGLYGAVGDRVTVSFATADGRHWEARAARSAPPSAGNRFELWRCDATPSGQRACLTSIVLPGGYGTTGSAVLLPIPRAAVGTGPLLAVSARTSPDRDGAGWFDTVAAAVVPASSIAVEVAVGDGPFEPVAVEEGRFAVTLPRSGAVVAARLCHGANCVEQSVPVGG